MTIFNIPRYRIPDMSGGFERCTITAENSMKMNGESFYRWLMKQFPHIRVDYL